ncbi:hypothetical protein [Pseudofrankia sp. DC12]|uniref:hypothetical protein n=1 Tax=Pseudofrankia sp. DC12 TaxID=683315 RepID=UPI000A076F56
MWDLTINHTHTFYIETSTTSAILESESPGHGDAGTAGATDAGVGILVHNCGPGDVVPYRPTQPGLENHHGVLDVWARNNVPGYGIRPADSTTVALTPAQHAATKAAYRDWLEEQTGRRVGGKVDWTSIGPQEIYSLSERMFDAAGVSQESRLAYYSQYTSYLYGLG